jgi:starvation-inducible outer membrane lipoprotein
MSHVVMILFGLLSLAGCSTAPPPLSAPSAVDPEWDLNTDRMQGTNDLIHPPLEQR